MDCDLNPLEVLKLTGQWSSVNLFGPGYCHRQLPPGGDFNNNLQTITPRAGLPKKNIFLFWNIDTDRYLCGMRNPDATKSRILTKSGVLFNTQGYKATSISDITTATGFTKGAIYRHFKSKAALEKDTLFHLSSIMFEKLRFLIQRESTAGDKLRAIFRYYESYIATPEIKGGCPLMNAAIEADDSNPTLRKEAVKILDIFRDSVTRILKNGIRHKQINKETDLEFYATVIIASLEGAIMMSKLRGDNQDIRRVIKHLELQLKNIEI